MALEGAVTNAGRRNPSIDLLRGIAMILMALDHVRDFFASKPYEPTDLDHTTPALFFTRWITHYCAPIFVFLAGTAAWLSRSKKSDAELTRFLVSRGIWLVVLEVTANNFFWSFRTPFTLVVLQVLWAIGVSMVVLAAVVRLPVKVIAAIGAILVVGHDALDRVHPFPAPGPAHVAWSMLHESSWDLPAFGTHVALVYPIVPWCGVMMLGYALGALFSTRDVEDRSRLTLRIGLATTALFVLLRASNLYGDPKPWEHRPGIFSLLSFLDCEKYPPSLCYLAMTLGPALVLLALFDRTSALEDNPLARFVVIYGRVPLFYYLIHVLVIHLVSNGVFWEEHHVWRTTWSGPNRLDVGLPLAYVAWVAIVAALYFPSRWFANLKASDWGKKQWWLSYL